MLQKDFVAMQKLLEANHPSLYWYTPKPTIDSIFREYYHRIGDSMNEQTFAWKILTPVVAAVKCGHTSVSYSKAYSRFYKDKVIPSFPLYFTAWDDSFVVRGSLTKNDSIFKRGTQVTAINGKKMTEIRDALFKHLPTDGFAENINYVRLTAGFPRYHGYEYGLNKTYTVDYVDSLTGKTKRAQVPLYQIIKDSSKKKDSIKPEPRRRITPNNPLAQYRSFYTDSAGKFPVMVLNSFTKGRIRGFFRKTFKELQNKQAKNLVIDLRANGGGRVSLSTLLTKYISRTNFRIADTVAMPHKYLKQQAGRISKGTLINIGLFFSTRKGGDGNYHLRRMERKVYKPKKKNHFDGNVYIITNGQTFSASTVFCNAVKGQPGIQLIGEESGGGWYGNNGIFIPYIKLPNTGMGVRLPLFRLVQYNHVQQKGTGIPPDILVPPTQYNVANRIDGKMKKIRELILQTQ